MSEKDMYLQTWDREFQTTLKVLKNYPVEQRTFRPHGRSKTAAELAWTFVMEEKVIDQIIKGEFQGAPQGEIPATMAEIIAEYERSHRAMFDKMNRLPDAEYERTMKFSVGPKQMGDFRRADVCWFMLMDMVHHRGQFSVYLRMVGGKVPSIYGPSADEPWM